MEFSFNNIDEKYSKGRPERMGDIQPKFWFTGLSSTILVKRQHGQKVPGQQQRSRMFNHFGEFFGYCLADKSGIEACPVELITLHDTRNRYSKTKHLYTACGSKKILTPSQMMILGESIINTFELNHPEKYNKILSRQGDVTNSEKRMSLDSHDNIDIILASIAYGTINYESKSKRFSEAQIREDVKENLKSAIDMITYDCIFGNNDRHSENWAMYVDLSTGKIRHYPLYDNERVLGLSLTEAEVRQAVKSGNLDTTTEKSEFSRMGISPIHTGASYKDVLNHLCANYPEYALPAIQKRIDSVSVQDIEALYDAAKGITERSEVANELSLADELPEEYRTYGVALYSQRRAFARDLLERYKSEREGISSRKAEDREVMMI